jgi:hypothetical protein
MESRRPQPRARPDADGRESVAAVVSVGTFGV